MDIPGYRSEISPIANNDDPFNNIRIELFWSVIWEELCIRVRSNQPKDEYVNSRIAIMNKFGYNSVTQIVQNCFNINFNIEIYNWNIINPLDNTTAPISQFMDCELALITKYGVHMMQEEAMKSSRNNSS
jgi:phosphomevalonate kinase